MDPETVREHLNIHKSMLGFVPECRRISLVLQQDPSPSAPKGLESPGRTLPASVIPIYQEGGRKGPGSCRPVRPTSVHGKIMEKIVLSPVERCLKSNVVIRCHRHGSTKEKSHLINSIFYGKVTHPVGKGKW